MKRDKSLEAVKHAELLMPGGVNSPVRAFKSVGLSPIIVKKAKDDKIYDIDGNEYIDYVMSYGPMLLGHADERVVKAVWSAASEGFSFGARRKPKSNLPI
jgi:glutamate-1-semialdehyde 2,1-aminomutase (EC 5.4.3.8)